MLSKPIYGGAYTYGKTESTVPYEQGEPRASSRRRPREEWLAGIPQAHEGYVSWEEFERIRQTMAANTRGWDRAGPVILALQAHDHGLDRNRSVSPVTPQSL
jgi:hypothetical protein